MTLIGYDDDLREVVSVFDRYLANQNTIETAKDLDAPGLYGPAWQRLVETTGLAAVSVSEEAGGLGLPSEILVALAEPLGRRVAAAPFLSSVVLATNVLQGVAPAHGLIADLAAGSRTATVAWSEDDTSWLIPAVITTNARIVGGEARLTGTKMLVLDVSTADVAVVLAELDGRPVLCACQLASSGVVAESEATLDPTVRLGRLILDDAVAEVLAEGDVALEVFAETLDLARLALAGLQVGGARAAFGVARSHVDSREQFGRHIGSFQAVKHQLADAIVGVEASWALVAHATRNTVGRPRDRSVLAPLAAAYVSESYVTITERALHLHGGLGFTWEADPHVFYKNALCTAPIFGTPTELREVVARRTRLDTKFEPAAVKASG